MWCGAHWTDKKKQSDELCEDVRLLVPNMTYSISMFCGCLAIIFAELNHHVECFRFVADIGTFTFCPKNLVVVVNKELCSEAITLVDRHKEDVLKNFMLSFCVRSNISSSLYKTMHICSNWQQYYNIASWWNWFSRISCHPPPLFTLPFSHPITA